MPKRKTGRISAADCILDERQGARGPEYLIRWSNYSPRHDSWSCHVTPPLLSAWTKRRRVRKWSKMLPAQKIVQVRGRKGQREYLVKFYGSSVLEWTAHVSEGLMRDFVLNTLNNRKTRRMTR